MWVRAWAASGKGTVSSVPAWFRADSGTNLIKQGETVTGRPYGSVAQWPECSHGMREVHSRYTPVKLSGIIPLLTHVSVRFGVHRSHPHSRAPPEMSERVKSTPHSSATHLFELIIRLKFCFGKWVI